MNLKESEKGDVHHCHHTLISWSECETASVGGSENLTQMSSERHSSESGGCCGELCWGKVTLDWGKNSKEPDTKWR